MTDDLHRQRQQRTCVVTEELNLQEGHQEGRIGSLPGSQVHCCPLRCLPAIFIARAREAEYRSLTYCFPSDGRRKRTPNGLRTALVEYQSLPPTVVEKLDIQRASE